MSQIFDVVIALIIVASVGFILTYIWGLVSMIMPTTMATILMFVISLQLVLFVIHRRD